MSEGRYMKKNGLLVLVPFLLVSLAGCTSEKKFDKEAFDTSRSDYYENVEKRNKFDQENELNFNDDITNPTAPWPTSSLKTCDKRWRAWRASRQPM